MEKKILNYDEYIAENWQSASVFNTPGMGNITSAPDASGNHTFIGSGTGEQDRTAHHVKMHERGHHDDSWMRPSSDYKNRNWLVPNFELFMDERQSNARFQIGQMVRCVDPMSESNGLIGKIIAFEDNTIRWEVIHSETGVGQTAKQYRCHAKHLEPLTR
jgi:hypothetical protein